MMSQSHNVINSKIGPCLMKLEVVEQQIWTKFIQKTNNGWWIQSMLSTCELCHWNNIFAVKIILIYKPVNWQIVCLLCTVFITKLRLDQEQPRIIVLSHSNGDISKPTYFQGRKISFAAILFTEKKLLVSV